MTKSKYKLQTVLDVRDSAKQDAAKRVALQRAQVAEAETELAQREQAVADCRAEQKAVQEKMLEELVGGTQARHVVSCRTHLASLRQQEEELFERVKQQRTTLERAQSELESALAALVEATKELQVMEKHREGWRAQTRRAAAHREQKLSDEIGAIIYERARKDET